MLPGIDDGPKHMPKSLDIARVAYANGTRVMIATPHKLDVNINSSIDHIRTLMAEFQHQLKLNNIGLEILLGMENHIDPSLPQDFKDGKALAPLRVKGKTTKTGTFINFIPSKEVFSDTKFSSSTLQKRMRELAFLNKGLCINLLDKTGKKEKEY